MTSYGCRENYIGQARTNADRVRVHKYKKQRGFRLLVKLRAVNILMCPGEAVFILFFLLFTIPRKVIICDVQKNNILLTNLYLNLIDN